MQITIAMISINAFEKFLEVRPDIILLDTHTRTPYTSIVKKISQSKLKCKLIYLYSGADDSQMSIQDIQLDKKQLTKEILINSINEAISSLDTLTDVQPLIESQWKEAVNFIAYPDVYNMLFIKYIGANIQAIPAEELNKLIERLSLMGEVEKFRTTHAGLILTMRKSKIMKNVELSSVIKKILTTLNSDYCVFYSRNINWLDLESACQELDSYSRYAFFLRGQAINVTELIQNPPIDIENVFIKFMQIVKAALYKQKKQLDRYLEELYIRILKTNLCFFNLEYARCLLNILNSILASFTGKPKEILPQGITLEAELSAVSSIFERHVDEMESMRLTELMHKTILYLLYNYDNNISLESVAWEIGVSKVYLCRVFKRYTGTTFTKMVHNVKISIALFYLSYSDLKVYEVAQKVGYQDSNYFGRLFKKHLGISPNNICKTKN